MLLVLIMLFGMLAVTAQAETKVTITTQPKNLVGAEGETVKTSVKASGDGLSYQWYYAYKGSSTFKKSTVSSSATYSVAMNSTRDGMRIYCVVKDQYGNSVKSNTVTLTMGNVAKITTQPKNLVGAEGETVKTSVKATGDGLTYQWYYAYKGSSTFKKSTVSSSATYSVAMTTKRDGMRIYCVVKDQYGNSVKSSTVTLSMVDPLVITAQPQNDRGNPGDQATFSVAVSGGTAPYTYQWQMRDYYFDWENLTNGSWFTGVNTNRLDLIVDRDEYLNENKYRCVITDANGRVVISNAAWVVEDQLRITNQPDHAYVSEFNTATYSITVTGGVAPYTYKWQQMQGSSVVDITGKYGDGIEKYTGWDKSTLSVKATSYDFAYSRKYRCVVTDSLGNTVTSEVGGLYSPLRFITQPVDFECSLDGYAQFSVKAVAGAGSYSYSWQCYSNTGWTNITEDMIMEPEGLGTEKISLHITNEGLFGMQIRCVAKDANGETVISDTAHVYKRFKAHISPAGSLYFDRGDPSVELTVSVTPGTLKGNGPYKYKWWHWYSDTNDWYASYGDETAFAYWEPDGIPIKIYCEVEDEDGNTAITDVVYIYSNK